MRIPLAPQIPSQSPGFFDYVVRGRSSIPCQNIQGRRYGKQSQDKCSSQTSVWPSSCKDGQGPETRESTAEGAHICPTLQAAFHGLEVQESIQENRVVDFISQIRVFFVDRLSPEAPWPCLRFGQRGISRQNGRGNGSREECRCQTSGGRCEDGAGLRTSESAPGGAPLWPRPQAALHGLRSRQNLRAYVCKVCDKGFVRSYDLKVHLRTHTGDKPFECDLCDFKSSQKSNLEVHRRSHSGEKPFPCATCDMAFSQSSALTKHMSVHSGECPFQCEICGYKTAQLGNLKTHTRIHTGETPFHCGGCGYQTARKQHLTRHRKTQGH